MLLPTSSYKAVSGEMPPEVVGQKTSGRSVCGSACRSTGWRGGRRHAFSWARRRDTGFIEASGAMFFLLAASNRRLVPFFLRTFPQKFGGARAHELSRLAQDAALACTLAS